MLTRHLPVYTLLALLISFPHLAVADDKPAGEIHEAAAEMGPAPANNATISPSPKALPDAPAPRKVMDKKFMGLMAALGGAETLRLTTHKLVLDNEFAAGAPWVTSVPSDPHMVAKYGGIFAAEFLVIYELKKPHDWLPGDKVLRKLWWVPPVVLTTIHLKNGIRSIRTQAPGGCPPEYCGGQ